MEDIVLLNTIGIKDVLVHGGGPEINHMLERVDKESKFIDDRIPHSLLIEMFSDRGIRTMIY